MKLKKIKPDHYVIVDDSELKEGDWIYLQEGNTPATKQGEIARCEFPDANNLGVIWKKITHSTPIVGGFSALLIAGVKEMSLQEVKELIGEVDVERKANDCIAKVKHNGSFIRGYNQALEDNKEKKWTDADVIRIVEKSRQTGLTAEYLMLSSQPQTEWEVEYDENGKLKLV